MAVLARREAYESRLAGFYERRERKVGHFISRERLERTNSFSMTDILRDVPGVKIRPIGPILKAVRIRGASCPPLVFLDGAPATAGEFDLETIDLGMVEGIEVYSGSATVPAEFAGPRNLDRCGVVAIWSRPFRPQPRATNTRSVDARPEVDLDRLVARGEIFTAASVDSAVMLVDGGLAPVYPSALWREQKERSRARRIRRRYDGCRDERHDRDHRLHASALLALRTRGACAGAIHPGASRRRDGAAGRAAADRVSLPGLGGPSLSVAAGGRAGRRCSCSDHGPTRTVSCRPFPPLGPPLPGPLFPRSSRVRRVRNCIHFVSQPLFP